MNVDTNGDGEPDDNVIEITIWKPEHNAEGPFPNDTMGLESLKHPKSDDATDPKSDDSSNQDPDDTNVNGSYYPGANMGGALTGDTTNIMIYCGMRSMALGFILYLLYKQFMKESC